MTLLRRAFRRDGHQESGDEAERNAHGQGGQQVDAHFGNRRVDQQQASKRQQHDAADGEHAVAGELGLGGEKRERPQDQHQGGKARGQQIESKCREQNEDNANRAGHDRAGVVELRVEREGANREQNESDVGIHQVGEDALLERHAERHDGLLQPGQVLLPGR